MSIDRAGDLDGDGIEDLWIADPSDAEGSGPEPFQCLWAVSGATGAAIRRIAPPRSDTDFATSVCAVGDIDGDGVSDIASASGFAPTAEVPLWKMAIGTTSPCGESAVFLFSGASGELLRTISGPADCAKVGQLYVDGPAVVAVGDWNADGSSDLAVGWAFADSEDAIDCGRVAIVSGADGSTLQAWHGAGPHDGLGAALCTLIDLDGDGRPELAATALPDWDRDAGPEYPLLLEERAGYVQVLSSKGGSIHTIRSNEAEREFGSSLARTPDVDRDGADDLLVGSPFGDVKIRWVSPKSGAVMRVFEDPYYVSWKTGGKQGSPPPRDGPRDREDPSKERLQEHVGHAFGTRLAAIPDRDGDGRPDVLATVADGAGPFDPYYAGVLSSKTGRPIAIVPYLDEIVVDGERPCTTYLGQGLCILPDMDGDAVGDFAIGGGSPVGLVCPGAVALISGKDLVPLRWILGDKLRN